MQVWAAWLDVEDENRAAFWSTLSREEQQRAGRFAFQRDRARFIAARGWLRAILGSCLGAEPQLIEFCYSAKGKPSLGGGYASSGLEFNLAHSGNLAVFAVARHGIVGVDVERVRLVRDLSRLTEHYFSARERAEVERLSGADALAAFFRVWTRKEAWLKATGEGITGSLMSFDVLDVPLAEPSRGGCTRAPDKLPTTGLRLHDLMPAPGFLGALAVAQD